MAAHSPPAIGPLPITSPELLLEELDELDELELLLEELELELLEELELLDELELELLLEDELELLLLLLLDDELPDELVPPQPASIRPSKRQARGLRDVPRNVCMDAGPWCVIRRYKLGRWPFDRKPGCQIWLEFERARMSPAGDGVKTGLSLFCDALPCESADLRLMSNRCESSGWPAGSTPIGETRTLSGKD